MGVTSLIFLNTPSTAHAVTRLPTLAPAPAHAGQTFLVHCKQNSNYLIRLRIAARHETVSNEKTGIKNDQQNFPKPIFKNGFRNV